MQRIQAKAVLAASFAGLKMVEICAK